MSRNVLELYMCVGMVEHSICHLIYNIETGEAAMCSLIIPRMCECVFGVRLEGDGW